MIIVKLVGGLGNQLFQYAFGRHLAEIHQTELKMDAVEFDHYEGRVFALSPFNLNPQVATMQELRGLGVRDPRLLKKVAVKFRKKFNFSRTGYIRETKFRFHPWYLTLPDNVYLDGYWQCEKYFKPIESIIRSDFAIKEPVGQAAGEMIEEINRLNSVAIHVRRGDYAANPDIREKFGLCSMNYYQAAIDTIKDRTRDAHFFLFSDDPQWVKEHFEIDAPHTIVSQKLETAKDYEDFRLMSCCQHNIIANSSFSWWAAWLNSNRNKIVIAPDPWFIKEKYNIDIIPESWTKLRQQ